MFNDPDRLISSTERISKNIEMTAYKQGNGKGGVSSYNDLTDAPMNVEKGAVYTPDTKTEDGSFGPTKLIKISDTIHPLTELIGAEITMTDGKLVATAANTFDVTSVMQQVGATGDSWALVSLSGNWMEAFDAMLLSCNGSVNFDMGGGTTLSLNPGTWIAENVVSAVLPDHMVVNDTYKELFLPDAGTLNDRSGLVVSKGKWVVSGPGAVTGISDYKNIKRIIGRGDADKAFPLWSQIKAMHDEFGEIVFDVINYDSENKELTILMHDLIDGFEFDAPEAICVCPNGLPAGTYSVYGRYTFTLTKDVPAGGVIAFDESNYQPISVSVFATVADLEALETVNFTSDSSGTGLDTVLDASDINYQSRALYGNGNYYQSALYRWLTAAVETNWWSPTHKFDRPPSYVNRKAFKFGFDSQFIDILAATNRVCATNSVYETGKGPMNVDFATNSSYETGGNIFFLPSFTELTGQQNNNVSEGTVFQAFEGLYDPSKSKYGDEAYIKYLRGQPRYYWERSCRPHDPHYVRRVFGDGSPGSGDIACDRGSGFAAACVIRGI